LARVLWSSLSFELCNIFDNRRHDAKVQQRSVSQSRSHQHPQPVLRAAEVVQDKWRQKKKLASVMNFPTELLMVLRSTRVPIMCPLAGRLSGIARIRTIQLACGH
jgi:hypothetical protein